MPGGTQAPHPGTAPAHRTAAGPPITIAEAPIAPAAARDRVMLDLIRLCLSRTHAAPPGSERPSCSAVGSRGPGSPITPGHTRGERSRCLCRRSMTASRKPLRRRCGHCSPPSASSWWPRTASGRGPQSSSRAATKLRPPRHHSRPEAPPAKAPPAKAPRAKASKQPAQNAGTARWRSLDKTGNVRLLDGDEEDIDTAPGAPSSAAASEPSVPARVTPVPAEADPAPSGYTPTEPVPAGPRPPLPPAPAEPAVSAAPAGRCRGGPACPQLRPAFCGVAAGAVARAGCDPGAHPARLREGTRGPAP